MREGLSEQRINYHFCCFVVRVEGHNSFHSFQEIGLESNETNLSKKRNNRRKKTLHYITHKTFCCSRTQTELREREREREREERREKRDNQCRDVVALHYSEHINEEIS
jgi:hypothetical protein